MLDILPPSVSSVPGRLARPAKKEVSKLEHNVALRLDSPQAGLPAKTMASNSTGLLGSLGAGLRDVPYIFAAAGKQARVSRVVPQADKETGLVVLPRWRLSRVRLPVADVSLVGWSLEGKRPVFNLMLLLVGCIAVVGLLWSLQGVGRGMESFDSIRQRAGIAYESVLAAQAALAEADFTGSEQQFVVAETQLREAQDELEAALSSGRVIMRYLDLTGTVRSGEQLLAAGTELTQAGQHITRGIGTLLASKSVLDAGGSETSLIAAVTEARGEFALAVDGMSRLEHSLDQVSSPLLPSEVMEQVEVLQGHVPRIKQVLQAFLDQSGILMMVLGVERQQQYLLLLQNNHELRPTGGFIGSIALVDVDKGAVEKVDVQSVYDPDGQLREFIAPPDPLRHVVNRWYLRDANWFVDFPVSAKKIAEFFEKEGGPTVDGVIALTPEVIRQLLAVTGPIEVPSFEVTVDTDNFWEVTQDKVTYSYDKELNQPKQFLSDLTPLLLTRLSQVPAESSLQALQVLTAMVQQKHLLLYFRDDDLQERLVAAGWAGELPRRQQGLLAINTANVGGHKSDQFVEQEIDYRLSLQENGDLDAVVTVRRTHRGVEEELDFQYPEGENPARKDNIVYQRVLVPEGAELISAQGFADEINVPWFVVPEDDLELTPDAQVTEWQRGQVRHSSGTMIGREAGHTFFANWLVTRPGETTVALYHYRLPSHGLVPSMFDPAERMEAMIVKQPGDMRSNVRISLRVPDSMRIIHAAPAVGVTQTAAAEVIYEGALQQDILVGAVYERKP